MDEEGKTAEKINALNEIFEDVISDATDLVKDLSWNVKTYLLFGLIMILFGISEIAYNAEVMQERYYLPLFVAGMLIFAGAAQIYHYFRLRKKYARLLGVQDKLKNA
jgi:predicted membrane channel-forming protein YqfA (hemolysin III family)